MSATRAETLRRRQRCHDLRAQGMSQREIVKEVDAHLASVRDWLAQPRPTDEEIATARPANSNISPVETLLKRQRCHDLRDAGGSNRDLQRELGVSSMTVRVWLARPRPTDAEVEATRDITANPKTDVTGQVGFKSRFDPELFAQLRAEADAQGAATNRVIGCAVRLYLDVMARARAGGGEPVDVLGYRA